MPPKRAISLRPLVAEPDPEQVAEMVAAELDRQMKAREREDWEAFVAKLPETAQTRLKKMVMRWRRHEYRHADWRPWFAWHPVLLRDSEWAWLERIWRRRKAVDYHTGWVWEYR